MTVEHTLDGHLGRSRRDRQVLPLAGGLLKETLVAVMCRSRPCGSSAERRIPVLSHNVDSVHQPCAYGALLHCCTCPLRRPSPGLETVSCDPASHTAFD